LLALTLALHETVGSARIFAVAAAVGDPDPLVRAQARRARLDLGLAFLDLPLRLLQARFQRCPPQRRPDYTVVERREAADLAHKLGLGVRQAAERLLVDPSTVSRWNQQLAADPELAGAGPKPPLPPIDAWVRDLVRSMAVHGFRGYGSIRNHLRLAGILLSRSSVKRFLAAPVGIRESFLATAAEPQPADAPLASLLSVRLPPGLDPALVEAIELAGSTIHDGLRHVTASLRERQITEDAFDAAATLRADVEDRQQRLSLLVREFQLLHSRFARLDPVHRPRFRPEQRFQVLEHQRRFRLACHLTARLFLLAPATLSEWRAEVDGRGTDSHRLYCPACSEHDLVARAEADLVAAGAAGSSAPAVARELVRRLSARAATQAQADDTTKPEADSTDTDTDAAARTQPPPRKRSPTRIRADYPNHVWFVDIFQVPCLGGLRAFVALVQDAYSRKALRARVFGDQEPAAGHLTQLLDDSVASHGAPRHVITDQGPQFQSEFQARVEQHGAKQRRGAVGRHGSIAVIERLILTLKLALRVFVRPQIRLADVQAKLDLVLHWYNHLRPHQTLTCATPVQRYSGIPSPAHSALPAPRRHRCDPAGPDPPTLRIGHVDPRDLRLPYLIPAA